jgi:hypothetical protein
MCEEPDELVPQKEAFDLFGGTEVLMDLVRQVVVKINKVSFEEC